MDLTPNEISKLEKLAAERGLTHVDIYWRERIRHALDGVEGLALRYQYLGIPLSETEQAAFFARYGKDLEGLIRGRFDRIEQKLDAIEYYRWRAGSISSLTLEVEFKNIMSSEQDVQEHFRICLELQGVQHEKRSIFIGCRDDFWATKDGRYYFDTKAFFWRERMGKVEDSWSEKHGRVGGGVISGIRINLHWRPVSNILVSEFDHLGGHFHFTENLADRIARVRFLLDDYVIQDREFMNSELEPCRPNAWPEELTDAEAVIPWRFKEIGGTSFDQPLSKTHRFG